MKDYEDLDILGADVVRAMLCGDVRVRERAHAEVIWRASGDPEQKDVRVLTMYPAIFDQEYTLYEGKTFVVKERVDPGFFDDVLGDDAHLNYSHESPSAMCRNNPHMPIDKQGGPGSMELTVDAHGLRCFARIPMNDLDAQRLAPKMDNGVVDQASYAFQVAEEDYLKTTDDSGRDVYLYTLKKCSRLLDVCVCPLGANSSTEAMLRSMLNAQVGGRSIEGQPTVESRSDDEGLEGGDDRSDDEGRREIVLREAEATAALLRFTPRREE